MKEKSAFIVAGSRDWNRDDFQSLVQGREERWLFAANEEELLAALEHVSPRYIFFLHWNWRLPAEIWSRFECVCFHMTDVPYGRGGSPLQNLIMAGHTDTMVSALRMVDEMDAGPVYAKRPLSLAGRAEDIFARAGRICIDMIRWMVEIEPQPVPQAGKPVLFKRRKPEQSALLVEGELVTLYDHIRMLDAPSYPLAFIEHGDFRLEFSNATLLGDQLVAQVVIRKSLTGKPES
jgi:methionyl-tRNA formyltransferase